MLLFLGVCWTGYKGGWRPVFLFLVDCLINQKRVEDATFHRCVLDWLQGRLEANISLSK